MHAESSYERASTVGDVESWLALGTGALLFLVGVSRRSTVGACVAVSSVPLLRGITGHWPSVLNGYGRADDSRTALADRFAERLALASGQGGAETLNYEDVDVLDALRQMTGGQGPDACVDAVGLEAAFRDKHDACIKVVMKLGRPATDTTHHESVSH